MCVCVCVCVVIMCVVSQFRSSVLHIKCVLVCPRLHSPEAAYFSVSAETSLKLNTLSGTMKYIVDVTKP